MLLEFAFYQLSQKKKFKKLEILDSRWVYLQLNFQLEKWIRDVEDFKHFTHN